MRLISVKVAAGSRTEEKPELGCEQKLALWCIWRLLDARSFRMKIGFPADQGWVKTARVYGSLSQYINLPALTQDARGGHIVAPLLSLSVSGCPINLLPIAFKVPVGWTAAPTAIRWFSPYSGYPALTQPSTSQVPGARFAILRVFSSSQMVFRDRHKS